MLRSIGETWRKKIISFKNIECLSKVSFKKYYEGLAKLRRATINQ